ncbi:hypothetical protein PoMZ_11357 [Pyricularia oryzae]|uniref:Uncharacterized protein n=1 Tax=Pyricularia oryzae TaxID=318829 RepID=A0A4P7NKC5_PYROR|nr:hypothetical protein PoMZ_11357 [Pyricularia oryzae]
MPSRSPDVVPRRSSALEPAMSRFLRWSPSSLQLLPFLCWARPELPVLARGSAGRPHKPV